MAGWTRQSFIETLYKIFILIKKQMNVEIMQWELVLQWFACREYNPERFLESRDFGIIPGFRDYPGIHLEISKAVINFKDDFYLTFY
jgi:hypothetical protein